MYNSCEACGNRPYQYNRDCMDICPVVRNLLRINENMKTNFNQVNLQQRLYNMDSYDYYSETYPRVENYSFNNQVKMRKVSIEEIKD